MSKGTGALGKVTERKHLIILICELDHGAHPIRASHRGVWLYIATLRLWCIAPEGGSEKAAPVYAMTNHRQWGYLAFHNSAAFIT